MKLNKINYDNEKEKIKLRDDTFEKYTEEREDEDEEIEIEDNHHKKMIKSKGEQKQKQKLKLSKKKMYYIKVFVLTLVFIAIITIIILVFSGKNNKYDLLIFMKNNETSQNNTNTNDVDKEKNEKAKNELNNLYNTNGEINVVKFYEENLEKNSTYSPIDTSKFTNIHINIGFIESEVDIIIKHISSALYHAEQNSFLHIHIMDADTFNIESLIKLRKMIYKINNRTEIIVYNASQAMKDFKIKENSDSKFSKDYAKLYAFKILNNIQKIIFLDSDDITVERDLTELYNLPMDDIYGRGISEVPSIRNPSDWLDTYIYDKSHYINGGVVLVNLELCQRDNFYKKAYELNNNEFYTKTEEPAQDIINVLMRKKIEFFHPKYNKINFYEKPEDKNDETKWYPWITETLKNGEKNNHMYSKEDLIEADNNPVIIHYAWDKQLNKEIQKYENDKNFYAKLVEIE